MRLVIAAIMLGAMPTAYCQSSVAQPSAPDQPGVTPPVFALPHSNFGKVTPQVWQVDRLPQTVVVPHDFPEVRHPRFHPQIDPEIVIHPSQSRLGTQQGTEIAQNQFPGLQFLPIEWPKLKMEPIPITWPNLKMESISTKRLQSARVPGLSSSHSPGPVSRP